MLFRSSPGSRDRRLGLHQDLLDMEGGVFVLQRSRHISKHNIGVVSRYSQDQCLLSTFKVKSGGFFPKSFILCHVPIVRLSDEIYSSPKRLAPHEASTP